MSLSLEKKQAIDQTDPSNTLNVLSGVFISVEGIEGVGKSTVIHFVRDYLRALGFEVLQSREPGGSVIAEQIRQLVLKVNEESMHVDTELLLMFASRAQHVQQVILPALQTGCWVVCDRFFDASYAYQGAGRGVASNRIAALHHWVLDQLKPDMTLLLDAPVEVAMKRMLKRKQMKDRIEDEKRAFFERVRTEYLKRAQNEPERFFVIDANQSLLDVQSQVQTKLDHYLLTRVR